MSSKRIPDILDYGDATEEFVDELARIDDDGVVRHLIFTRRQRSATPYSSVMERRVITRLIVPTHMVGRESAIQRVPSRQSRPVLQRNDLTPPRECGVFCFSGRRLWCAPATPRPNHPRRIALRDDDGHHALDVHSPMASPMTTQWLRGPSVSRGHLRLWCV